MTRLLTTLLILVFCLPAAAELGALQACRQRVADYAYFWDQGDTAGFAALFTEDATLTLSGTEFAGRDAIVARMTARRDGPILRHLMSTVRIRADDGDGAQGVSYVTVYAAEPVADGLPTVAGFAVIGEYHDRFDLSGGDCRIAERTLVPIMRQAKP